MNTTIVIDWRFVIALGTTAVGVIFATKMEPAAIERVSNHVADACQRK